jgi:eukaryotic-like serine/threonine-protein kinase
MDAALTRFSLPDTHKVSQPTTNTQSVECETEGAPRGAIEPVFPFRVGPYSAIKMLGRGGMGVVYLAERTDAQFDQQVALKVLPLWAQTTDRARFLQERQILARMEHPYIAHLLDGGLTEEGAPYFAMEVVEGEPLMEFVARKQLSQAQRLSLILKVCDAVHYAHQCLVVHRDLKPSNILVGRDGNPKLLDFGIAKIVSATNAFEHTATAMMTPAYAAPEQLLGQSVSTLTDVFALGVLLYELLTGKRPRAGANIAELVRTLEQVPLSPSALLRSKSELTKSALAKIPHATIHEDLDLIVMTALQREATRRYSSVEALAKDLRAFMANRPIQARPDSWRYRFGKLLARNPIAAASLTIGFAALLLALAVSLHMAKHASAQAEKADAVKQFMLNIFSASDPNTARAANVSVRELLDTSFESIGSADFNHSWRGAPETLAEIQSGIAAAYANVGEFQRALDLLKSANEFPSASAEWTRAQSLRGLGLLAEAQTAARAGLVLQPDPATRAKLLAELSSINAELGDYVGAESVLRDALEQIAEPASRLQLNLALADLLLKTDHTAQALALLDATRAGLLMRSGPRNTHVAALELIRADALESSGQREAALASYRAARETFEVLLGPAHPKTLIARDSYSFCLLRGGQTEAAELELRRAIDDGVRVYGENHYAVATLRTSLSTIYARRGDLSQALQLAESALATRARIFAENAPQVLESRNVVTTILSRLKRYDEASQLINGTIVAINTLPPSMRERKLSSAESRASEILRAQGKDAEALVILQRILDREDRADSSFDLQPILLSVVRCALRLDDLARAQQAATRSKEIAQGARAVTAHRWTSVLAQALVQQAAGEAALAQTNFIEAKRLALEMGATSPAMREVEAAMQARPTQ